MGVFRVDEERTYNATSFPGSLSSALSLGERPWLAKKMCCVGGVVECIDCCCDKLDMWSSRGSQKLNALSGFEDEFSR